MIREKKFWQNTMSIFQHNKNNVKKILVDETCIYKSVFKYLNSNMYIIIENNEALVVDPNPDDYAINLLKDNDVKKVTIMLTHEHRDHIYGIYLFQENFETNIISTKQCSDYISNKNNSRPIIITYILEDYDNKNNTNLLQEFNKEYVPMTYKSDKVFEDELTYYWQGHKIILFSVQGHSKGSCAILFDDRFVFTGDTLLKIYPVITRFPGGSTKTFKNITVPLLEQKLNSKMTVFPGHGEPFKLDEIMKDGKLNVEIR